MNQNDDSGWPALDKATKGYRKGEILVITGGRQSGRSRLAEMAAAKLSEAGHKIGVICNEADENRILEIPQEHLARDEFGFPTGKRRKPKKRKLRRKVGKL